MLANLPIMLFPYAHKCYAFIFTHYALCIPNVLLVKKIIILMI